MMQRDTGGNQVSMIWHVLELAIVFSVFSQMGPMESVARPAMYVFWALVIFLGMVNSAGAVSVSSFTKRFIAAYILFYALSVFTGFFNVDHYSANYLRIMRIPLLVTIASDLYVDEGSALINRIGRIYLVCSVILAVWVHWNYFPSYSLWLGSRVYLYAQKNSAGQIWVMAILVSMLMLDYRNTIERILIYAACCYLLIMTGFSQCRTALLGFAVAVVAFSVTHARNKLAWIVLIGALTMAIWSIPATHRFIEQALFLNKFMGADMNTISSGRLSSYRIALQKISISPFFGTGEYYVDCSYLLILVESGLFGLIIIQYIWLRKIAMCFIYNGKAKERNFLFMATVFYIIESILEGYPPFGPGVSSFMYWLLSGILIGRTSCFEADLANAKME